MLNSFSYFISDSYTIKINLVAFIFIIPCNSNGTYVGIGIKGNENIFRHSDYI